MVNGFRSAIFDVDGVLVDSPHEEAWREALRELMEGEWAAARGGTTWSPTAFVPLVYAQQVSGKSRMSGARAALEYFHVPDVEKRTAEYAGRKQALLVQLIEAGSFTAFPDGLRFVIAAKEAGLRLAVASSSKHARLLLQRIRVDSFAVQNGVTSSVVRPGLTLLDLFDVDVSGRDFARGKPHPEMFLTAAQELGVLPRDATVFEDAPAGITAAKAGGMVAVAVARADDADLLADAGADIVVTSLDDLDRAALAEGRLATMERAP